MKRNASQALLAVLLLSFVALEFLYPSGPEITGESFRPDRRKYETVRDSFPEKTIEYFLNVGFRPEKGNRYHIRKWNESLRIRTLGRPSEADRNVLRRAVKELSPLIAPLEMTFTERDPNVEVYVSRAAELPKYEPNYELGSRGTYWCWWSSVGAINRCRIVIATDLTSEPERHRALRTFLLGVLGFMGSPPERGEDSLLDIAREPRPNEYSSLGRDLVRLLYRDEIYPGMSLRTARSVLIAP